MESDNEIPEGEEEILVYVEFEGLADGSAFSEEQLHLDMIGIDTDHPIMQINGRFYEGTYEDAIGTYMFFTKNDNPVVDDPVFDSPPSLQYFAKTRKYLKMQRIFVKPRTEVLGDSEHSLCIPNLTTIKQAGVPERYQAQALSFWKTMRDDRIVALNSYLERQRIREEKKLQGLTPESESDEDNPFAMYKHGEMFEDIKKCTSNSTDMEEKNLKSHYTVNTDSCQNILPNETSKETANTSDDVYSKDIEKLVIMDSTSSTSENSANLAKCTEEGPKILVSQRHELNFITNVQNTMCKKQTISTKFEESPASEEEDERSDVTECSISSETVADMNNATNQNETISLDAAKLENVTPTSVNSKIAKQLKREAKMVEISKRLKTIAEEYLNAKVDQ